MKVKYNTSTGEVVAMAHVDSFNLESGMSELTSTIDIPRNINHYKVVDGSLVEKSASDIAKVNAEKAFNAKTLVAGMGKIFMGVRAIQLAQYSAPIEMYAEAKNFVGLKAFIDGLYVMQEVTEFEYGALKAVVAEQGVNLDNY